MKKIVKKGIIFLICVSIACVCLTACAATVHQNEENCARYIVNLKSEKSLKTFSGESTVQYTHLGENTLTSMSFHLYANSYQNAGGNFTVSSVYVEDSLVAFSQTGESNEIMRVLLKEELFPNESVSVKINYTLTLPEKEGIFGISGDTVRLSAFYPVLCPIERGEWQESKVGKYGDYIFSECADMEVTLTLPTSIVVASSGKRVSTVESGEMSTYTYKAEKIRDFAFCLSQKYHTVSAVYGSTYISAYAFSEEEGEQVLSFAQKAFAKFSEKYGKYTHQTFSIALCEIENAGMEYDGLVYIDRELKGEELELVVVHETAHEWWYGAVGGNPTQYAWLDEGLAEYSVLEYVQKYYGIEKREQIVSEKEKAYSAFVSANKSIKGKGDIPLTQNVDCFSSLYEYVTVTYTKGMLFFENLKSICGEKKFNDGLKRYYKSFSKKIAKPEDLCECLSVSANKNLIPVFDAWEKGKVYFGA